MNQTITANNTMLTYAIRLMAESYAEVLLGTYKGANSKEEISRTLDTLTKEAEARGMMDTINPMLNEIFA